MTDKATGPQLFAIVNFLRRCETAAMPPAPAVSAPTVLVAGLLGQFIAPVRTSLTAEALPSKPESLREVLEGEPPFEAKEKLPPDRIGRIALLNTWLNRFPGFPALRSNSDVKAALKSFEYRQRQRRSSAKFTDDLADFRFWLVAAHAMWFADMSSKRAANARERIAAVEAATRLLKIADSTTALQDLGFDWKQSSGLREGLEKVRNLGEIRRSKRFDKDRSNRDYVRLLTDLFWYEFGDAPPTAIHHLAALKLENSEITPITKQVSARKKELANEKALALGAALSRDVRKTPISGSK